MGEAVIPMGGIPVSMALVGTGLVSAQNSGSSKPENPTNLLLTVLLNTFCLAIKNLENESNKLTKIRQQNYFTYIYIYIHIYTYVCI